MQKRFFLLGAILCSLMLWFVSINIATTGHTKVIKTTGKVVRKADRTGNELRRALRRAQGDRGEYVQRP